MARELVSTAPRSVRLVRAWFPAVARVLSILALAGVGRGVAAQSAAPSLLAPANGASVQVPFTISWSAVLPGGQQNGGYNWQVSTSPSFTTLVLADSTNPATTQDTISGLVNGTYHWRVNAVDAGLFTSAWSTTRSFVVTGAGPGSPPAPVLQPTRGYSTFHPWESVHFDWNDVPEAITYRLEVSNDPNFPLGAPAPVQTFWNDNISGSQDAYVHTMEGNWFARVFSVTADNPTTGVRSLPSNVIQFSCFYNNPIGPPPVLISPLGNPMLTLPVTLSWAHVPNPQASGYILEISRNSGFTDIEWFYNQYTEPTQVMLSLTSGPKFWRVRSQHGNSSPTTAAITAPSTTGTFTISSAPATPVSIKPSGNEASVMYSGASGFQFELQLTAGVPAGGANVALTSSHPSVIPLPATFAMQGTHAWAGFPVNVGFVTTPTVVTLSATLNGVTASNQVTVRPPTLNDDPLQPEVRATGGATMNGWVNLEGSGRAAPGGFLVNLSDNSPLVTVPATVTIGAGFNGTGFQFPTSAVTSTTHVTITASANGVTTQWQITLEPGPAPTDFFVRPISTTNGSQGVVSSEPSGVDQLMQVTSSNPSLAAVPSTCTVSAGSGVGFFNITTVPVTSPVNVTISVSGGGVTLSCPITVHPSLPPLLSMSVNPTSVAGGTNATGSVTLGAPAPSVGLWVKLESNLPLTASLPESVFLPSGATSATFTVTTFPTSFTTTAQLSAQLDSVIQFSSITVGPPAPPPTPGTPSLLSPANLATVAQPITFDWTDASNAVSYTIQIDSSSNFTTPLTFTQTVSASTTTVTGLPAQQLWWRVRGTNSAGVNGSFSSSRRFTAQAVPPSASLTSLSVSPTSVVGGNGATGTATLTSAAPTGGLVVTLSSSNTSVATVPASVTVASGATSATFTVTTLSVASTTAVTITGVGGGATRTATLTVQTPPPPASLSSASLNPTSVNGGTNSTGTATLTSAAPAGGLVVTLSSSNTAVATVPASVTVAAGATSATFTVSTSTVASTTAVTLTGVGGGATRTATLTVNPVPTGPLPAPSLVSPANDARFDPGQNITFDWSDVAGAASYTIQIDNNQTISAPFVLEQTVTPSTFSTSTLPTQTMWWRVRANDSAGNPGNWSSTRRFEVKN